jgi:TP901 family phage tail tape measure protein
MAGEYALSVVIQARDAASSVVQSFLSHLGPVGDVIVGVGGALFGVGVESVKMASNFQTAMNKVQVYTGLTQQQTKQMGDQILQLAPQLGQSATDMANGLYTVATAGYRGNDALTILSYAGKTAASANVSSALTMQALVHSMDALGLKANQSGNIMDELNATVKQGDMTWDQYGTVIGKLAGIVSAMGGSAHLMQHNFTDLNASLDVYTNSGVSARQASMWLNADMSLLDGKTSTLATHAKKLGLSFSEVKFKSMDFAQQLQYLNTVTKGNHDQLVSLLGGNSTVANSVSFLNNHYGMLTSTIHSVTSQMKNGQTTNAMFATTQKTLAFQVQKAKASFDAMMITIGQALLPIVTKLMSLVSPLITTFTNWIVKSGILKQVTKDLTNAITPVVSAISHWFSSGKNLNGIMSIVGMVVKQVGQIVLGDLVQPLWHLVSVVAPLVLGLARWLVQSGTLKTVLAILGGILKFVGGVVGGLINGIASIVGFFEKFHTAALLLMIPLSAIGGYLVFLAVDAALQFLATLPEIIAGFLTEAGVATLSAIATLAAAWPFIAVGLAIGILIVIIVLLVKHWGAVIAFLRGAWQAFSSWFMGALHAVGNFFASIWNGIVGFLRKVWAVILSVVKIAAIALLVILTGPMGLIALLIITHWTQIKEFLGRAWAWIKSTAETLWSDVTGVFRNAWSGISNAISSLWNNIVSFVSSWPGKALQWGKDLIQNLINGILGMIGNVGSAIGQVASKIASFIHFSKPDTGPLASVESWMPDFGTLLASGLAAQKGKLSAAVTAMVQPLATGVTGVSPTPALATTGAPAVGGAAAASSTGGGVTNIYLTVNAKATASRQLAEEIMNEIEHILRMGGQQVKTASGRRY